MSERRRYTRKTKTGVVIAAIASSVAAAAQNAGIPESTVHYWFDSAEFAELRKKTREDLAAESMGMAHKVLAEIQRRIGEFEPRDLSVLYGILTDKGQLLAGHATARAETRTLPTFDDHESTALAEVARELIRERVNAPE